MATLNIIRIFVIFYDHFDNLGTFSSPLYSSPLFGMLCQEKSGNPVVKPSFQSTDRSIIL
jgi:hypothetical protein